MKFFPQKFLRDFLLFMVLMTIGTSQGQSIWTNTIDGTNPATANPFTSGDVNDSDITVSGIGRGSGISANAGADRYNATGFTTSASIDANDYFSFTLTPVGSAKINFSSFAFTTQRSNTGPVSGIVKSSLDNYSATIGAVFTIGTAANTSTITLTDAAYQNIASAITFRVYYYKANGGTGTASINDFVFSGTVSSAVINTPSPTSLAFGNVTTNTNSVSKSFTVSGTGISGSIAVAVPAPYQVSNNSTTGFASSFNLAAAGGTVYVRFSPTATGSQPATVTLSAAGATNKTVALTGTGVLPPSLTTTTHSYGPFCNGIANTLSVAFTTQGTFDNTDFHVQISDANGIFTNTQTNIIGTGTLSPVTASFPAGLAPGNYKVRMLQVSNSSVLTFSANDNGSAINVSSNTWTGTTNSDWNTAANWSCGVVPTGAMAAVIAQVANPAIVSGNMTANAAALTVNTGATLVVTGGSNLNLTDALNVANGGTVTFENNSNLIQQNNVVNQGTVNIHRNSSSLYNLDYTIWSAPTAGTQTLKAFSPNTLDERFYVYNTAQNAYSNYTSTSGIFGSNPNAVTFTAAKGYLIRMPDGLPAGQTTTFNGLFTGTPNNGAVTLSLSTGGNRYNAVGNPYPSPINIWDFIDANAGNLDNGTLYFWRKTNNPAETTYATITKLAYNANTAAGGDTGSAVFAGNTAQWTINTGQGFFVKAAPAATSLVFNNAMRRAANNNQFFKTAATATPVEPEISRFSLNLSDNANAFGQTVIGYTNVTTNNLDYGWDGLLLNDGDLAIYTKADNTKLAIQARAGFSVQDVVPVSYKAVNGGNITLSLNNFEGLFSNQNIYLKDKTLNAIHDLKSGSYAFTTEAGTFENRFEIVYENSVLSTPDFDANQVVVYKQNHALHINSGNTVLSGIKIFDISGRLVYEQNNVDATEAVISNLNVSQQVLIVQLVTAANTTVSKKIIY